MTTRTHRSRVTVLGLGHMGTAVARVLSEAGHDVTVWNRTSSKSEAFQGSATIAPSVASACQASDVVLSVLSSYAVTDEILQSPEAADALRGRTLIQMSTGTPDDVRTTASWAARSGVQYLDAKIIAYPNSIGTELSTILYSGAQATFERWQDTLAPLAGENEFVGHGVTDASTFDLAWLGFWYGASASFLQSLALCRAEQLPVEKLLSRLRWMVDFIEYSARDAAARVERADFSGADCALEVHRHALEDVTRASKNRGLDDRLPAAVIQLFDRAISLGYGSDELPALYQAVARASSRVPN